MNFSEDHTATEFLISSYSATEVVVNQQPQTASFILLPGQLHPWPVTPDDILTLAHFEPVLSQPPELVLLGTGAALLFPSAEVQGELLGHGIGFEVMTTPAACRTYNLLAQDGRTVGACLMLPA